MGWYYTNGGSRRDLIKELTTSRERSTEQGVIATTCLASCYRGGVFSGVLWAVWERTFSKEGQSIELPQRWISCDLLRCDQGDWGHKPMEESMHPYFYSCPLGYLAKVPIDQYGGHAEWREGVRSYHAQQAEKRQMRKLVSR